jgi:hypothetical protein
MSRIYVHTRGQCTNKKTGGIFAMPPADKIRSPVNRVSYKGN